MNITIETEVKAPLDIVWGAWVTPADIVKWNYAIEAWCCPRAQIDLIDGGKFNYRMEAKDGSFGFDFEGTFTKIVPKSSIEYVLGDDRIVLINFSETPHGVRIIETFETEDENSAEKQRQGWQSILDNFKNYVENKES